MKVYVDLDGDFKKDTDPHGSLSLVTDSGGGKTNNLVVTVAQVDGSNKFHINGKAQEALHLVKGETYIFDLSGASSSHPFQLATKVDGAESSVYSEGVTISGTQGSEGAKLTLVVTDSTPTLYYYCTQHSGMGSSITIKSSEETSPIKVVLDGDTV